MLKEDVLNEIKSKNLPVIIAGAGIVGKILLNICKEAGIKVDCFCDSSIKVAEAGKFCDLKIIYTPDLKKFYENATVLISVVSIKDVVDILKDLGFLNWYAGGLLLKDYNTSQVVAALDYNKFAIEKCILCHDGYLNPERFFLRSIDIVITERCSLKCRNCSNLMQYYEKPQNLDLGMLLISINAFCQAVDEVMEFRVLGGDVFMNKDWPVVVKRLTDEPKANRVVLYTNGTLMPLENDIVILKHPKVLVVVSNYGVISRNLTGLKQLFEREKIVYHILEVSEWLDCATVRPRHRGEEENKRIFKICCAKNITTLSDGKVFRCPYAANANRLAATPNYIGDYVDLFAEPLNAANVVRVKNKLKNYILNKDYLKTCDFCSARPLSGAEVEPAEQINKPLPYHKYSKELVE